MNHALARHIKYAMNVINHVFKIGGGSALFVAAATIFTGCAMADDVQPQTLRNFEKVNDRIFRGAEPSTDGFKELATLGVHTVIDLRGSGSRSAHEAATVRGLGMEYVNVPLDGYLAPTQEQVSRLLNMLEKRQRARICALPARGGPLRNHPGAVPHPARSLGESAGAR